MTKRLKLPVLMLLITALALTILASCTSVGIASVTVKEDCNYKTEYVIGEELDLAGLELVVTRTDGEVYTVFATDVREDLKIMNFKTDKAEEALNVVVEYKGVATSITIKVVDKASATAKYTVTFSTGEGERIEPVMAGEFETIASPKTPTREGYVFDGWYKQSTYNDQWNFNIDKVVEDTTLYAKWSKLYSITFKYDPQYNSGTPDVIKYVKAGGNLADIPALPHVEGMVGSWSRTTFTDIYSNIVVNAQYVVATYKVVFYYMDVDGVTPYVLKTFENVPYGTNLAEEYADEIANLEQREVPKYSTDGTKHFANKWSQSFNHIVSDLNIEALYEINKYDVSFMQNDGTDTVFDVATGVVHNNPVNNPTKGEPTRDGYAFDGWYKNAEGLEGYNWNFDTDRVTGNIKLYAKWTKLYTVEFTGKVDCNNEGCENGKLVCTACQESGSLGCNDCQNGLIDCLECEDGLVEFVYTFLIREGANATRAPLPIREGYTATWYIGETPLNDEALQNVRADKHIEARFTINSYTVTFYNYNRDIIDVQTVNYKSDAVVPNNTPQRLGYKFMGWEKGADGNEKYKNIKADTEVVATFEADVYLVNIVPNVAGQENSFSVRVVYDSLIGSDRDVASVLDIKYEGYNFDGWYTDNNWSKSWNLGANVLNVNTIVKNTLDKENQTLEEKTAEIERKFRNSENVVMTLYAKWSKIHTIRIYNEEDIPFDTKTVINGNCLKEDQLPTIPVKEGVTGGWYVRGESDIPFDFTQPILSDVALAIIYKVNVYTVNFYKGIGELHHTIKVEHNERIQTTIPDPVVEGKIFKGWDLSLEYTIITKDTDIMALFDSVYYDVTWSYNGITYAQTQVEHGKQAIFPSGEALPTREGHKLTGWSPISIEEDVVLDINNVKSDMEVVPEWSINTYTIEFKDRETGGLYLHFDGQEKLRKNHDQCLDVNATVANPTKAGKDFIGWTVGAKTIKFNSDLNAWVLVNAYGDEGVYSIAGASVSLIIRNDQYYYSLENPTTIYNMIESHIWDESKIFAISATENGWVMSSNNNIITTYTDFAFNGHLFYVITSDMTFYSNHVTSVYSIDYVTDTEMTIDTNYYDHGQNSIAPSEKLVKDNYVFIGWYTEPEFKNKYVFGSAVTSDITLYARWEVKRVYSGDVIYELNESGTAYTLTGVKDTYSEPNLIVANFYGDPGLPVNAIGAEALAGNSVIRTISLPNTLVNIGPGAFMNMTALESIDIPETVQALPDNIFKGSKALETVSFGNYPSLTTIGAHAFHEATALKYSIVNGVKQDFTLPESLTTIGSGAFYHCTALTEIYIPENVISIGDSAFAGANGIRYAVFARTIPATLGEKVFQNNTTLQHAFRIYVPDVQSYTMGGVSANWKLLKDRIYNVNNFIMEDGHAEWSYTLGTDGRIILIQYLGNLTEVSIPLNLSLNGESVGVSGIGDYAFDGRITSVAFDANITISENTFASTASLYNLSITVGSENAINPEYLKSAYSNVINLNTLSVSPNVVVSDLFGGDVPTALATVKTLAGVNNVMGQSFLANCTNVKEVIINGRTENVSQDAFLNCIALERVVFDYRYYSDLLTIGANAFNGATSLVNFEIWKSGDVVEYGIPTSVQTIGANAFEGTRWLNANYSDMIIVGNGILYRYNGNEPIVAIPETVTAITASAFSGNAKLRQVYVVNIENSVLVDIGANAFANCANLEAITLPARLKTIGKSAFENDTKLATIIHFGSGEPASIGEYAFSNVHPEKKIYLPDTASKWSNLYDSILIANLAIAEETRMNGASEEKWIWAYGDALSGTGRIIVKAFGKMGGTSSIIIPEQLNIQGQSNNDVYEIADYALPRTIEKLDYSTFVKNTGAKPFGGVTFLNEITIRNSYNNHRIEAQPMMSLFVQNENATLLNTVASISMKSLLGGVLPAHVKTVNILDTSSTIAKGFLEDNEGVENITLTIFDKEGEAYVNPTVVNLEDTADMSRAHRFVSVGAKAFRNTAWMKAYQGEYVIVLGGNLVDYKGVNSVLEIPSTVSSINGSIFENDSFIEVVYIPESVKSIGANAFNGTSRLTKIFISGSKAPSIQGDSFDVLVDKGLQIFVNDSALNDSSSGYKSGDWQGMNPLSDKNIIRIKNEVSKDVFEEYIINTSDNGTLLLSRKYKVTYDGALVSGIVEYTTVTAPVRVVDESNGMKYDISSLGNNVFMSSVQNIALELTHTINDYTFYNLGNLDIVTVYGTDITKRGLTGNNIVDIFDAHKAQTIAFSGNFTLTTLMGKTGGVGSLVGVKIIDGITETVDELLKGWTDIASVTFPESIQKVGINSLEDTEWFKEYTSNVYGNDFVVLGGSLLYKYKGAGAGGVPVTIPGMVEIVNTGAFSNYDGQAWSSSLSIRAIRFANDYTAHTILDHAFSGCVQLSNVLLPTSMRKVAPNAFDNTKITMENGMLVVSGENGENPTLIKFIEEQSDMVDGNLVIPANIRKIAAGAFQGATTLKVISYTSDSVLSIICEDAFNGVTSLETVKLPTTIDSIGKNAFYNTLWLGNQINSNQDVKIGSILYQRVESGSTYELKEDVTSVVEGALLPIESFIIGDVTYSTPNVNVTAITIANGASIPQAEMYSILSNDKIVSLRTNGQVTLSGLIGSTNALDNIKELSFHNEITSIVARYAENWNNVTSVTNVPATVTEIGENAFRGTAWFDSLNRNGFNYAGESRVIIKYVGEAGDLVIGASNANRATGFTADAFRGNESLKSVMFGAYSTIDTIPAGAFRDCVNLESVVFNDKVVNFGEDAFVNTAWINNYNNDFVIVDGVLIEYKGAGGDITIPKGTSKIYPYVFRGNDTITSVTFDPNAIVTKIEANTFRDCVNLVDIFINEFVMEVDREALQNTAWLNVISKSSDPILYYQNSYYGIKRAVLYVGSSSRFEMPTTITELLPTAFRGVETLTELIIDDGKLTSIPDHAFEGCINLANVDISSSVTYIGEKAFNGTPWLAKQKDDEFIVKNGILIKYNGEATNVVIPENVTLIERGIFDGMNVTSIDMSGANIETILDGTFRGLTTLATVIYSDATTYIGEGAFEGTAYLSSLPEGLTIVNDVALIAYVGEEDTVTIPNTIRYLNADVFQGNEYLLTVIFSGDIEIAPYAFVGSGLFDIVGVEFITHIGTGAFDGTMYEDIKENDGFIVVNNHLVKFYENAYTGGSDIVIPSYIEYIPEGIFTGNKNITSVDFSKVKLNLTIEANAFRNAINLRTIVFSDNIEYVGNRAFYNTAWMDSYTEALIVSPGGKLLAFVGADVEAVNNPKIVTIPNTVNSFARDVFKGNANLTGITFEHGTNAVIPSEAFKDCTALKDVNFNNGTFQFGENAFQNTYWYYEQANNPNNKGFVITPAGLLIGYEGTDTDIEIPSSVTYIYDYVFKGNENITSLRFARGSSVTSITGETFVGCTQLTNVIFNDTLEELDISAFEGTPWKANLTTDFIVVGNKLLTYIGNGGEVKIPSGIEGQTILQISAKAFQGNETITAIIFDLASDVTEIPSNAFDGCVNLEKIVLPEGVEYVGKDAFKGTKWLATVSGGQTSTDANGNLLDANGTIIGEGSIISDGYVLQGKLLFFFGDANLERPDTYLIPEEGITMITRSAFEGTLVKKVIAYEENLNVVAADGAFDSITAIYVPDDMVDTFKLKWEKYNYKIYGWSEQ